MPFNGEAVIAGSIGVGLLWAALNNKSLLSTAKDVVKGQKPAPAPVLQADVNSGTSIPGVTVGIPAGVAASSGGNKAMGQLLAAAFGWGTGGEWNALVQLWDRESGWNNHADNPSSHAYGIPQALPYTKMPQSAWPESAGGSSNAQAQIGWGLTYIKERYGSPEIALAHENAAGWY